MTRPAGNESRSSDRRHEEELSALRRVAFLVAQGGTTAELGRLALEEAVSILGVPSGWFVRFEPGPMITVVASVNDDAGFTPGTHWPLDGESLSATIYHTGRPARIDDFSTLNGPIAARTRASGITSVSGVPITVEGALWGLICVGATAAELMPPDTEARLQEYTELVEIAIANAESRDRLQLLVDEHAALHRVAALVAQAAPAGEVYSVVSDEASVLLGLPSIEMVRYEAGGAAVVVIGSSGDHPFSVGGRWALDGPSVTKSVFDTGSPARIDDYRGIPGSLAEAVRRAGFYSAIGVPIVVEGATWGAIIAFSTVPDPIPEGAEHGLGLFTELVATAVANVQAHDDLRSLASEQAALRRVATLVAEGSDATEVFDAVCVETGRLLEAAAVNLSHYTADGINVTMAGWSLRDTHVPVGARFPVTPDTLGGEIVRTHAPARIDRWEGQSELAQLVRSRGIRSSVAAPVTVDGRLWGALVAASDREGGLPPDTELRLARFTDLIATAISNAATKAELIASRARIVSAGDEARRRIERNLHDGTQQRLIALGLDLQRIRAMLGDAERDAHEGLERAGADLESVLEDVRELSRGLHPPLLSRSGLLPPLRAIARRSPIPVEVDVDLRERPPAAIETALYYVVSEALTNAIRYSKAKSISVTVETDHGGVPFGIGLDGSRGTTNLHATVVDDGVGGAEMTEGSGLRGLADRVDALGGRFVLESSPGSGTRISIMLPVEPS